MNTKQLLIDTIPFIIQELKIIKESTDIFNKDDVILTGVIQRANVKNHNGRIYSKELLLRLLAKLKLKMQQRSLFGLMDHPDSFTVSLKHSCILILDYWWQGDDVYGKILVLSNSLGLSLKRLILKDKAIVGISSRGAGTTRVVLSGLLVQDDFELITFDIVSLPSTIGAWMYTLSKQNFDLEINLLVNNVIVNL